MAYGYVVITAFLDLGKWYDNAKTVDGKHQPLQHVIDVVAEELNARIISTTGTGHTLTVIMEHEASTS